jgi:3-dehydroquinate dehydratase-1
MIALSIKAKTIDGAIKIIEKGEADLYELRGDALESLEGMEMLKPFAKRLIVTVRSKEEGGFKEIPDEERLMLFKEFIQLKPKFIDVEFNSKIAVEIIKLAKDNKVGLILSYHNFKETPHSEELKRILHDAKRSNPEIVKIVTFAKELKDNLRIISLYEEEDNLIAFCMGEKGKISRVFSLIFSPFTYVGNVAPGQLTLNEAKIIGSILGGRDD